MATEKADPAKFVAAARSLLGARWRHLGRKPWAVDCIGLLALSAQGAGLAFKDARDYGREPWDGRLGRELADRFGAPLPPKEARVGDIALIRWRKGEPSHVAIVGNHPDGWLTLIHAHNVRGVVEHSLAPPFESVVVEVYRPWRDTSFQ